MTFLYQTDKFLFLKVRINCSQYWKVNRGFQFQFIMIISTITGNRLCQRQVVLHFFLFLLFFLE